VQGFNFALRRLDHVRLTAAGGKSGPPHLGTDATSNVRMVPASPATPAGNGRPTRPRRAGS
jgi:hypothetical protein